MPHTRLTCVLPAGAGQNLTVTVSRDGQSGSRYALTYASPKITPGTLKRSTDSSPTIIGGVAVLTTASMNGGDTVVFQGQYFGTNADPLVIQGALFLAPLPCCSPRC